MRRTKIVATVGPASSPEKRLRELVDAGVDVFRLNFSHGDHRSHQAVLERIRKVEADVGRPVAVLQDLCGPKIRLGLIPGGAVELVPGRELVLIPGLEKSDDPDRLGVSLPRLAEDARPGQRVLIDDGLIELKVVEVSREKNEVRCEVVHGGTAKDRKGVNLPDTDLTLQSFTEKDRVDLAWGLKNGVDFVALSFVRHEDDVKAVRELCAAVADPPQVIAKIERPEAVKRLREVVTAFDGVMVARGDLSVELPLWLVPAIQKKIIRTAIELDRFVITATQMLDSMQENPRPTRAEASDVANAIFDGTDAVMLSGETASGKFPVEAVKVMARIAVEADHETTLQTRLHSQVDLTTFCDAICGGALSVAEALSAKLLVTFTRTGRTARLMSRWQPKIPILGVTTERSTQRKMCLYRGVAPVCVKENERSEALVAEAEEAIARLALAQQGDIAVYVGGTELAAQGNINSLKVRRVGDAGDALA